ncbi:bZIP transcription factor 27 isoform X2 [Lactuca sativa]|uniref:bZIP transcription factor 27 isoform X2 n=1 Tax=Lactuca sativa TaxID=4236 RepID=UPI000CBC9306|nr:bZIP transcription factor 27 isoform X2 [Lactuca sativa]XP_042754928.1 bZIP transcription factor 27 isoform X2 [Lactuca sativa]XP_042754929.1 bZIP transcription factor 27 isoform X2 [Lactuca sativa]XP_052624230.1 bZIP transcription factor 27 isoform X2 [Lactuca sativa]
MKPMDDVWKDISSLPSLHHPTTTHHLQDFFTPAAATAGGGRSGATLHHPSPPEPPPPPPPTTMLSLSTSGNSAHDQEQIHNNPSTGATSHVANQRSPPEYSDKFKRLMKNRESAGRSRARKQARADELEHEVLRLKTENAKLKRLQKELCSASSQFPKKPKLQRTRSAPF